MNKLKSFVGLDYLTIKPYLGMKFMLITVAIAFIMSLSAGSVTTSMGVGLVLALLFMSYPFAISDKVNMEVLYTTLAIGRNDVIKGRYFFVLLMDIAFLAIAFVSAMLGIIVKKVIDSEFVFNDSYWLLIAICAGVVFIQCLQLPIFFKFGYTKAKMISILPMTILIAVYSSFFFIFKAEQEFANLIINILVKFEENKTIVITGAVVLFMLAVFVSYKLSLAFYKKREF